MRSIWVTFRKEGIQQVFGRIPDPLYKTGDWDDACLGYPYRHKFYFKVWIEV